MIKFEHTLFALPFALAAAAIAARGHGLSVARLAGIVVAMAGARTAAMGFNRIVDRHIDAKNPRTARREIPAGRHLAARRLDDDPGRRRPSSCAAAAALGPLCLALSPVALVLLFGYSFTKRFTALCHLFLGPGHRLGPGRRLDRRARRLRLGARPAHDRRRLPGSPASTSSTRSPTATSTAPPACTRSPPASASPARWSISALLHLVTVVALVALAPVAHLGAPYLSGVAVVIALLVYEHAIVRPSDLSRLDVAFFNLNGYVSVAFFIATLVDTLAR